MEILHHILNYFVCFEAGQCSKSKMFTRTLVVSPPFKKNKVVIDEVISPKTLIRYTTANHILLMLLLATE